MALLIRLGMNVGYRKTRNGKWYFGEVISIGKTIEIVDSVTNREYFANPEFVEAI